MIGNVIFATIIFGMLIFEFTKKRAFLITQEMFPKKENAVGLYWLSVISKIVILLIVLFKTFQEYVVA